MTETTAPPPRAKRTRTHAQAKPKPVAPPPEVTEPTTDTEAVDLETGTEETPASIESTTSEGDRTEAEAAKAAEAPQTTPEVPVDPFDYDQSTLTLSLSFLPLVEGVAGRTVIVSVHSKNGTAKSVLPEFMAPLHESELNLPDSVLALIKRYRTVTLPKRKAEAAARAAERAAKRPTQKQEKAARPGHVATTKTPDRRAPLGVSTQLKLQLKKGQS